MRLSLLASASVVPGLERRQGRPETDRAGYAVEHDIRLDRAHQLLRLGRAERDVLDAELAPPARSIRAPIAARAEPDDLETVAVGGDHLERLHPDRPG